MLIKTTESDTSNAEHPDLQFTKRVKKFLQPYLMWPVSNFGPDELLDVQNALVSYEYVQGKKTKRYTRGGINNAIKWIRRIWKWGMGRQFITENRYKAWTKSNL
jgi:hypothetical protein